MQIHETQISDLVSFLKENKIDFVIVGPEKPLSLGIVDAFLKEEISILGPAKSCAILETSKAFSKDFIKNVAAFLNMSWLDHLNK